MDNIDEIPDGVPVTIDPKRRYIAGNYIETDEPVTLLWGSRLEEAVRSGQAKIITVGKASEVGDLEISEFQDLRWEPDPSSPHPNAESGVAGYDTSTERINLRPGVESPLGKFGAMESESTTTEILHHDYSESYPKYPNQPIAGSPPALIPHPGASNPILTAADVTDVQNPDFVADPFIVYEEGTYHLFFEVRHDDDGDGNWETDIAHATSADGLKWEYNAMTNVGDGHDAYPYVFKHSGDWYMTPDNASDNNFEIWRATDFPLTWEVVATPLSGRQYTDPTLIEWDGAWYMWAFENTPSADQPQTVLFYSDKLFGGWSEHPTSPITQDARIERPAGRPIVREDAIDIWYMDNRNGYGDRLRSYRVTELTEDTYQQQELATSPVLMAEKNGGWNSDGMHHIDIITPKSGEPPIIATDGINRNGDGWALGIYTVSQSGSATARLGRPFEGTNQEIASSGGTDDGRDIYPWTQVTLDQVEHDTERAANPGSGTITIPQSGYYVVEASLDFTIPAALAPDTGSNTFRVGSRVHDRTRDREIAIDDNMVTLWEDYSSGNRQGASMLTTAFFEEGDELAVDAYQDSGGIVRVVSNSAQTHLTIQQVR